ARSFLDRGAREAIHDARLTGMLGANEFEQLLAWLDLFGNPVTDVGAIEARDKDTGILQVQPLDDLFAGSAIRRGRQSNARNVRKTLGQHGKTNVLRSEIVTPLRHTMSFVDGKERNFWRSPQQLEAPVRQQPLGRDVEQIQFAGPDLALDDLHLRPAHGRIE